MAGGEPEILLTQERVPARGRRRGESDTRGKGREAKGKEKEGTEDGGEDSDESRERLPEKKLILARVPPTVEALEGPRDSSLLEVFHVLPKLVVEFLGIEAVVPTSATCHDRGKKNNFFVIELRNVLISYARTDDKAFKVNFFSSFKLIFLLRPLTSRKGESHTLPNCSELLPDKIFKKLRNFIQPNVAFHHLLTTSPQAC
jgi:hypothetical protein